MIDVPTRTASAPACSMVPTCLRVSIPLMAVTGRSFRRDYAVQDGIELRHISRAPHARRCELDFRNHIRGPSRRAQGAQEGWTPERFAAHVVVAFPEKGLRVHHEALKGVHRPPPSTNFLWWPSRRYARFRTPSPSRGPPPQGGVLPGGNPPSRKRRYRPPRWPGASLASARVRLAESARPPWPRSPAPPPPSPSSPRDRSRSPPAPGPHGLRGPRASPRSRSGW